MNEAPPSQPSWADPAIPDRDACVLRHVLERRAVETPDQPFLLFDDGQCWTYAETRRRAAIAGAALWRLGVRPGDPVASWLPNGPDAITVWFGANWIGAIYAPLNVAYKGGILRHVLSTLAAPVLVAHDDLLGRLDDLGEERPRRILSSGSKTLPLSLLHEGEELSAGELPVVEPWHTQSIIFTSGTTGPSKGVLSSYTHLATGSLVAFEGQCSRADRYMVNLPLFHVGGTLGVYGMLLIGASAAVVQRFDTHRFWALVRDMGVTSCTLLGVMASFLAKAPPASSDQDHGLKDVILVPFGPEGAAFMDRFGVTGRTMFNMTEVSIPLISAPNPTAIGGCGTLRAGVEARLVDDHDREVAEGETGELILRAARPWSLNHGYYRMAEATAGAWRNGWFHTGDAFRRDEFGEYYFVDRAKDSIRRRGENISSFELEAEVLQHPAVREAAAIGVTSDHSEEEVLVALALTEEAVFDERAFVAFLADRLPHFMVPRYLRVLVELPKTPTNKVQKHLLRAEGVTHDTWDREAAGLFLKSTSLRAKTA